MLAWQKKDASVGGSQGSSSLLDAAKGPNKLHIQTPKKPQQGPAQSFLNNEQVFSFEVEESNEGQVTVMERLNSPPRYFNEPSPASVMDFDNAAETTSEPSYPLSPTIARLNLNRNHMSAAQSDVASPPSRFMQSSGFFSSSAVDESAYLSPVPSRCIEDEAENAFASPSSMTTRRLGKRIVPRSLVASPDGNEDQSYSVARSRRAPSAITNDEQAYLFHAMNRVLEVKSPERVTEGNPELRDKLRERAMKRAETKRPPSPIHYRPEGEHDGSPRMSRGRQSKVEAQEDDDDHILKSDDPALVMGRMNLSSIILLQTSIRRFVAQCKYQRLHKAEQERALRVAAGRESRRKFAQVRNVKRRQWAADVIFNTVIWHRFMSTLERRVAARKLRKRIAGKKIARVVQEHFTKRAVTMQNARSISNQNLVPNHGIEARDLNESTDDPDELAIEMELESWIEQQVHTSARTIQRAVVRFIATRRLAKRVQRKRDALRAVAATRIARAWRLYYAEVVVVEMQIYSAARILQRAFGQNRAQNVLNRFVALRRQEKRIKNARAVIYRAVCANHSRCMLDRLIKDRREHRFAEMQEAARCIQRAVRGLQFRRFMDKRIQIRREMNMTEEERDALGRDRLRKHGRESLRKIQRRNTRKVLASYEQRRRLVVARSCATKETLSAPLLSQIGV